MLGGLILLRHKRHRTRLLRNILLRHKRRRMRLHRRCCVLDRMDQLPIFDPTLLRPTNALKRERAITFSRLAACSWHHGMMPLDRVVQLCDDVKPALFSFLLFEESHVCGRWLNLAIISPTPRRRALKINGVTDYGNVPLKCDDDDDDVKFVVVYQFLLSEAGKCAATDPLCYLIAQLLVQIIPPSYPFRPIFRKEAHSLLYLTNLTAVDLCDNGDKVDKLAIPTSLKKAMKCYYCPSTLLSTFIDTVMMVVDDFKSDDNYTIGIMVMIDALFKYPNRPV